MKKFSGKILFKSIISLILACVIFAVIFICFCKNEGKDERSGGANIVLMGDSIFANNRDTETSICAEIGKALGCTVLDLSFGGSTMAYSDRDGRPDYTYDAVSMASLAQAIITNDFRYQTNAGIKVTGTDYFPERISALSEIDFDLVDILVLEHMLNDYQKGIPARADSDKYDEYTYEGALRTIIEELQKKYPELTIVLVTPPETWYFTEDGMHSSCELDLGGGKITEYIEVQKEIALEYNLQCIDLYDLYRSNGIVCDDEGNELNYWDGYTIDDIHPNFLAIELIGKKISESIEF